MHRDTVTRSSSTLSCHSSAAITFYHDNPRFHVTRIFTQLLEAENVPVLPWAAYSPDMSPIEHVWDALDRHVRQRVPVPANIQQHSTGHNQQPDQLYAKEMCPAALSKGWSHQILTGFVIHAPTLFCKGSVFPVM
uniref:Tc1-like transposase DDE domain-containing protein n=1 Tax=Oncorhynchus tshawytscha TaxID=74940 RepID=A0AAZ3R441_ONCTS